MSTPMNEITPQMGGRIYNLEGSETEVNLAKSLLEQTEHVVIGAGSFLADKSGTYRPVEIVPGIDANDRLRLRRLVPNLGVVATRTELPI